MPPEKYKIFFHKQILSSPIDEHYCAPFLSKNAGPLELKKNSVFMQVNLASDCKIHFSFQILQIRKWTNLALHRRAEN